MKLAIIFILISTSLLGATVKPYTPYDGYSQEGEYNPNGGYQPLLCTSYNLWEITSYVDNPNGDNAAGRFDDCYTTQPFKAGDSIQTSLGVYKRLIPYYLSGWLGYESLDANSDGIINNTMAEGRRTSMDFFAVPVGSVLILFIFALIYLIWKIRKKR